jgi:hypothetical protein
MYDGLGKMRRMGRVGRVGYGRVGDGDRDIYIILLLQEWRMKNEMNG